MTVQITPIDIYQNTWGDTIDRLNQLIEAANTQIVTIGGVNIGNVAITGTLQANNLVIDNFSAGTSNVGVLNANNVNANTVTAPIVAGNTGVFTNANVSANLSANVVGGNYVIANTIIAGPVYDANGNLFSANTLVNGSYIATPAVVANTVQVTDVLLVERIGQNFTANVGTFSQVNANTFNGNTVNTLTLRVNNRTNLQKFSDFDLLPSRLFGTDSAANVIQYNFTPYGITLLNSPNSANAKSILQLDQVDNTADMAKPISVSTQAALDLKVDKATRVNTGAGLTGGGALTSNVTVSLSANTIASLAKADTAIQANSPLLVPGGGTAGQVLQKMSSDPNDYSWQTTALTTAVQFISQTLTQAEQLQARTNIGVDLDLYAKKNGSDRITVTHPSGAANTSWSFETRHQNSANSLAVIGFGGSAEGYIYLKNASNTATTINSLGTSTFNGGGIYANGTITVANQVLSQSTPNDSWGNKGTFYAPTFGRSYVSMANGAAPFASASDTTGSSYAPIIRHSYGHNSGWGGVYSAGVLNRNEPTPGAFVIAHINSSANQLYAWEFQGANGNFTAPGNITGNSDRRIKSNIETISDPLNVIKQLRGCRYLKYGLPTFGFIAQEVEGVVPELVHEGSPTQEDIENGTRPILSLDQGNEIPAFLVEGMKVLIDRIEKLEAELAELRGSK